MKRIRLALVFDLIFIFAAVFLPVFTLLRYFLNSAAYPLALGLVVAFTVTLLFSLLGKNKKISGELSNARKSTMNGAFLNLGFYSQKECLDYFEKVLKNTGASARQKDGGIYLSEKDILLLPHFLACDLDISEICLLLKGRNLPKSLILTTGVTADAAEFMRRNGITALFGEGLFELIEKSGVYPKQTVFPMQKKARKRAVNIDLSRKKSKQFLFFGISLLLLSLIIPYPLYYIILGTGLIAFSLYLKFFAPKEPQRPPPPL